MGKQEAIVMIANLYSIGDEVEVLMPNGYKIGTVNQIMENYGWPREVKYLVQGEGFTTIASARVIRNKKARINN